MSQFVYGVFENRSRAEAAIDRVDHLHGGAGVQAVVHEGHLHDDEIQMAGTQGLRGMIAGGLVSGVLGAVIAALFLAPAHDMAFGLSEFFLVFVGGTIFGITAGGVAGASEAKREVAALGDQVRGGKVVVTMEVPKAESAVVAQLLGDAGATVARAS